MKKRLALKILASPPSAYPWTLRKEAYKLEPWLKDRLLAKARRRLRDLDVKLSDIRWQWCAFCEAAYVNCPQCKNNTCNGGSICGLCYYFRDLVLVSTQGKYPQIEDIPGAAEKQHEFDQQQMRNAFEGL